MARLTPRYFTRDMTKWTQETQERTPTMPARNHEPQLGQITRAIARRSFCTLATASSTNRPHVAGVAYEAVDTTLYVNTGRASKKARNIADNPDVGVFIPIRRLPVGPPSSVHFQAVAEILAVDDPHIVRLLEAGRLKSITSHGELDEPEGCFLRITPARRINT